MTYIISTITDKSILMASDSRLNYHNEESDSTTGERYQVIVATADCIRKTFTIDPFNIGIQFIGTGYFSEGENKYPLSHFIPRLSDGIDASDSIAIKFDKIYQNVKKLTQAGNTGQYINGVMTGYENTVPYICTFNTFINDFTINSYDTGAYVESVNCIEVRPKDRDNAIKYINDKISSVSRSRPQDVGGPIEILELTADGLNNWIQSNPIIFNGALTELIHKWQNDPHSINGKILNPPIRQKLEF
jgi:hypothetical protein